MADEKAQTQTNATTVELPIIDISAFTKSNLSTDKQRAEIINKIEDGFSNTGFILLKGHHLDQKLLSSAFVTHKQFFNLPSSILSSTIVQAPVPRGYAPLNSENFGALIGQIKPNDLNCKFRIGPEYHSNTKIKTHKNNKQHNQNYDEPSNNKQSFDAYYGTKGARCLLYPNIWPSQNVQNDDVVKAFKSSMMKMHDEMYTIAQILFDIFENIFVDKHQHKPFNFNKTLFNKHTSILSTNYYPTKSEIKSKYNLDLDKEKYHRLAIEEHSDIDIFTIIAQNNNEGGVEVNINGKWLKIPYDEKNNYLIINIGDGMQYLTNKKWKSTKHRVLIPPNDKSRQVIAFFAAFNYDALMKPLIQRTGINKHLMTQNNDDDGTKDIVTYFKWRTKRIRRVVQHLKQQKQVK